MFMFIASTFNSKPTAVPTRHWRSVRTFWAVRLSTPWREPTTWPSRYISVLQQANGGSYTSLTFGTNILGSTSKYAVTGTYNLTIMNVDSSDDGIYQCSIGSTTREVSFQSISEYCIFLSQFGVAMVDSFFRNKKNALTFIPLLIF